MRSATAIEWTNLAWCLLPVAVVLGLLFRATGEGKGALYAVGRMLVQLSLVGYVLAYLFGLRSPLPVVVVLVGMLGVASWITLRPLAAERRGLYPRVWLSLGVGGGSTLALVTQLVLELSPWFAPRYVIPLAGMIFANSMNSLSVAAERHHRERERGTPAEQARDEAMRAGMIGVINSLLAVGVVSLPGMMTGQILSGASPLLAARYQIMVMCMLFGASGVSISTYLWLATRAEASGAQHSRPD